MHRHKKKKYSRERKERSRDDDERDSTGQASEGKRLCAGLRGARAKTGQVIQDTPLPLSLDLERRIQKRLCVTTLCLTVIVLVVVLGSAALAIVVLRSSATLIINGIHNLLLCNRRTWAEAA